MPFAHLGAPADLRIIDRTLQAYRSTERLSSHLLPPGGSTIGYRANDADPSPGLAVSATERRPDAGMRRGDRSSAVVVMKRICESVHVDEQDLDTALAVLRLARALLHRMDPDLLWFALPLTGWIRCPQYAHLQPILATSQDQP